LNEFRIEISLEDRLQAGYCRPIPRHMQPLTAHVVPARVQVKPKKLGETGTEMGVPVGVNSERANRADTLPHDAFKRGADLAVQQR